jgi:hypothetical protein
MLEPDTFPLSEVDGIASEEPNIADVACEPRYRRF